MLGLSLPTSCDSLFVHSGSFTQTIWFCAGSRFFTAPRLRTTHIGSHSGDSGFMPVRAAVPPFLRLDKHGMTLAGGGHAPPTPLPHTTTVV